jgi:phosphoribosylamine--glycine ligase
MRNLLRRKVKIGSPRWQEVKDIASAQEFINTVKQAAIKPIGLTGGKGVRVMGVHFHSVEETLKYVDFLLEQDGVVLLEERLVGEEFSRIAFVSGDKIISTPVAQDFKYALDGDEGSMTGGMGAYTMANGSMPFLSKDDVDQADSILKATVKAIEEETGKEYRGFLYGQFIATANGVYVIEFNVRLGDPEAINLMTLLQADTVDVFTAIAENSLKNDQVSFSSNASVCKYLVPTTYPDNSKDRLKFDLALDEFERSDLAVIYASIVEEDGALYSLGSRTLAVVGLGENAYDISDKIESLLEKYEPAELRHRKDIGDRHVIQLKTDRLNDLRSKASQ